MGKLIKEVVLDRTTTKHEEYVDFVVCCNCGKTMLVDLGTEKCPECNEKSLMWENGEQEVNYDSFSLEYKDDYILCDHE